MAQNLNKNDRFGYYNLILLATSKGKLNSTQSHIMLVLWGYCTGGVGSSCWICRKRLAAESGYSERTIDKYKTELENSGWLKRKNRIGETNIWTLSIPNNIDELLTEIDVQSDNISSEVLELLEDDYLYEDY